MKQRRDQEDLWGEAPTRHYGQTRSAAGNSGAGTVAAAASHHATRSVTSHHAPRDVASGLIHHPAGSAGSVREPGVAPGVYSNDAFCTASSVQLKALDTALIQFRMNVLERSGQDVHAIAAEGMGGQRGALPFADKVQRSFGHHDIGNIQAYTGSVAGKAAGQLGAHAYATGNAVVLGGRQDLHTIAHEAAHVVQQRGGVSLKSGVGESGDRYERHADAVADLVVQGRSAQALLDTHCGGPATTTASRQGVQLASMEGAGATWEVVVDPVSIEGASARSTRGVVVYSATEGVTVGPSDLETALGLPPGSLVAAQAARCYEGASVAAFAPAASATEAAAAGQRDGLAGAEASESEQASPQRSNNTRDVIALVQGWIAEMNAKEAEEDEAQTLAWTAFTPRFNAEFANILNELGAGADGFTHQRLQEMFTVHQRQLLEQYMAPSHPLPEGLFNQGLGGGATAPQRILMSSHMLVHGTYEHREDGGAREPETDSVHAGSCGNWARLVLDYAGASPDGGASLPNRGPGYGHLRNDTDIEGGLNRRAGVGGPTPGTPGIVSETPENTGDRTPAQLEQRNRRRDQLAGERIPHARLLGLEAGDWIYIFNNQGASNAISRGQHSLIFIRWIEMPRERVNPADSEDPLFYGIAMTQDQLSPSEGGQTHDNVRLGDRYQHEGPKIYPVTRVTRVTPETGPAEAQTEGASSD